MTFLDPSSMTLVGQSLCKSSGAVSERAIKCGILRYLSLELLCRRLELLILHRVERPPIAQQGAPSTTKAGVSPR